MSNVFYFTKINLKDYPARFRSNESAYFMRRFAKVHSTFHKSNNFSEIFPIEMSLVGDGKLNKFNSSVKKINNPPPRPFTVPC